MFAGFTPPVIPVSATEGGVENLRGKFEMIFIITSQLCFVCY